MSTVARGHAGSRVFDACLTQTRVDIRYKDRQCEYILQNLCMQSASVAKSRDRARTPVLQAPRDVKKIVGRNLAAVLFEARVKGHWVYLHLMIIIVIKNTKAV